MSEVLVPFVFELRRRKLRVGPSELSALARALLANVHESTLEGFYHVARALFVHTETELDTFDEAFSAHFRGAETETLSLLAELDAWLRDPAKLAFLSEEQRARLEALDLERLRQLFAERLAEQRERHQGGSKWIGTGGTSPFGAGGQHPTGLRVGPQGGGRSAIGVADARRFQAYRGDRVLDVRQIEVALRKLRSFVREGAEEELDLETSIAETARSAGELEVVMRPLRRSNVRVILLMDVGGSMDSHVRVVEELFSAARRATHFKELRTYYFHNAIYGQVFETVNFREPVPLSQLFRECDGQRYHLVVVGDAAMHPGELWSDGPWYRGHGASEERRSALEWFHLLAHHFGRHAWLNPDPPRYWTGTVEALRRAFAMFPLTLDGLGDAVMALSRGARR